MNLHSDLHSQRPEYQRVMIDFSICKFEELLKYLKVSAESFDSNNVSIGFLDRGKTGGGNYDFFRDHINIDFRSSFDLGTYMHEFSHAYSSSQRSIRGITPPRFSSGFITSRDIFNGLNEGITEVITQGILDQNTKEIKCLEKKYKNLRIRYKHAGIVSQDISAEYSYESSGEKGAYISERLLVNALLYLLAYYSHQKNNISLQENLKALWEKIMFFYFTRNRKGLFLLVQKVDPDGKIWKLIQNAQVEDTSVDDAIDVIVKKVHKIYESGYTPRLGCPKLL